MKEQAGAMLDNPLPPSAGVVAKAAAACTKAADAFRKKDAILKELMYRRYGLPPNEEMPDEIVEVTQYGGIPLSASEIDRIMIEEGYPIQSNAAQAVDKEAQG